MTHDMEQDIQKVLLTEAELAARVAAIGEAINGEYAGKDPLILCVLRGSFVFMADLCRQLRFPCTLDFIRASSYGAGSVTSGEVSVKQESDIAVAGRHVIIVEDILDSGTTLERLSGLLKDQGALSVKICVLLDKPSRRQKAIQADYVGFTVPDEFVVGYGLDFAEKYRHLPYVGVLKPEVYA